MIINRIKLNKKKIMVVGDIMLDTYLFGEVNRVSPESPVPVVEYNYKNECLGGSGNVIRNLLKLNINSLIVGFIGKDSIGEQINSLLNDKKIQNITIVKKHLKSIQKMRIIGNNQQIARIDRDKYCAKENDYKELLEKIKNELKKVNGVIISDYGKGICQKSIVSTTISNARALKVPIFIDPKGSDWDKYRYSDYITPNTKEAEEVLSRKLLHDNDFVSAGKEILERYDINACIITRGSEGMTYVSNDIEIHIPSKAKNVFDVSGAGDTVISCFSAAICNENSVRDSLEFANIAAGNVVGKFGTAPVCLEEL